MAGRSTDVVCASCGERSVVPLKGAVGRASQCQACGAPCSGSTLPNAPAAPAVFERVYRRLEAASTHVPANRWAIVAVYFGVTAIAEAVVYYDPFWGFVLHALVLFGLLVHAGALSNRSAPLSRLAIAISLLPVIRLVSLAVPLASFTYLQWFLILGVVVALATITALRVLGESAEAMGLKASAPRHFGLEAAIVALGIPLGILEYKILAPGALVAGANVVTLVGPVLMMIAFGGFLEELIYRGLLLRTLVGPFGPAGAVAIPALANAIFAVAYGSIAMVVLALAAGLVYGLVARRTESVIGVGLSRGVANALLFVVLPVTGAPF